MVGQTEVSYELVRLIERPGGLVACMDFNTLDKRSIPRSFGRQRVTRLVDRPVSFSHVLSAARGVARLMEGLVMLHT